MKFCNKIFVVSVRNNVIDQNMSCHRSQCQIDMAHLANCKTVNQFNNN